MCCIFGEVDQEEFRHNSEDVENKYFKIINQVNHVYMDNKIERIN